MDTPRRLLREERRCERRLFGRWQQLLRPCFVANWVLPTREVAPARMFEALASFSRLIVFDKRGTGLSHRVAGAPDMEARLDDARAVTDAVGSKRAPSGSMSAPESTPANAN